MAAMGLFLSLLLALATFGSSILVNQPAQNLTPRAFPRISPNVLPLIRKSISAPSPVLRRMSGRIGLGLVDFVAEEESDLLLVEATFGNQTLLLCIDTGSSDTWVIQSDNKCFTLNSTLVDPTICYFGPAYIPSSSFVQIQDENFNTSYGDGEYLTGILGKEVVTLGGITVHNQIIGVVENASWNGDGHSSGLLGLSYPSVTNGFPGKSWEQDSAELPIPYDPVFFSMWKQHLINPVFSIAAMRQIPNGGHAGYLALGGVPPVLFGSPFVSTRIISSTQMSGHSDPGFYAVEIETMIYRAGANNTLSSVPPTQKTSNFTGVLDCGTTQIRLPPPLAATINALFQPPAFYHSKSRMPWVQCSAVPPRIGFQIGGSVFYINAVDMIRPNSDGTCTSNVLEGGPLFLLGMPFFWNTLVVHDIGAELIWLANRENCGTEGMLDEEHTAFSKAVVGPA